MWRCASACSCGRCNRLHEAACAAEGGDAKSEYDAACAVRTRFLRWALSCAQVRSSAHRAWPRCFRHAACAACLGARRCWRGVACVYWSRQGDVVGFAIERSASSCGASIVVHTRAPAAGCCHCAGRVPCVGGSDEAASPKCACGVCPLPSAGALAGRAWQRALLYRFVQGLRF